MEYKTDLASYCDGNWVSGIRVQKCHLVTGYNFLKNGTTISWSTKGKLTMHWSGSAAAQEVLQPKKAYF